MSADHAAEAIYAELMTGTAKSWRPEAMQLAFDQSGGEVYAPISGDKIACLNAGPGSALRLYRDRDAPMQIHLTSIAAWDGELWIEGDL